MGAKAASAATTRPYSLSSPVTVGRRGLQCLRRPIATSVRNRGPGVSILADLAGNGRSHSAQLNIKPTTGGEDSQDRSRPRGGADKATPVALPGFAFGPLSASTASSGLGRFGTRLRLAAPGVPARKRKPRLLAPGSAGGDGVALPAIDAGSATRESRVSPCLSDRAEAEGNRGGFSGLHGSRRRQLGAAGPIRTGSPFVQSPPERSPAWNQPFIGRRGESR
jgi:hypothetical protein